MSDVSPTPTIAGDSVSIVTDATLVSTIMTDINWTPQSRFMRFYNTPTFPPVTPLAYIGDPGTDATWASVSQPGTSRSFFRNLLDFITSKLRSFFERLARMNILTACL